MLSVTGLQMEKGNTEARASLCLSEMLYVLYLRGKQN